MRFIAIIVWIETPNRNAMRNSVSPEWTTTTQLEFDVTACDCGLSGCVAAKADTGAARTSKATTKAMATADTQRKPIRFIITSSPKGKQPLL